MKSPTNADLHEMREKFMLPDWDTSDFLDWFAEFGRATIEEVLQARGETLPEAYDEVRS